MRISDWSSDVCSSDLRNVLRAGPAVLVDEFRVACKAAAGQHHGLVRAQHTCVIGLRYFDSDDPSFFVAHQAARAGGGENPHASAPGGLFQLRHQFRAAANAAWFMSPWLAHMREDRKSTRLNSSH